MTADAGSEWASEADTRPTSRRVGTGWEENGDGNAVKLMGCQSRPCLSLMPFSPHSA